MPVGHLYVFYEKLPIQFLCSFFNQFSPFELYEFFTYFGYKPLIRHIACKYLLPFSRLPFRFVDVSFAVQTFKLDYVPFVYFFFCFLCLRKQIYKNISWASLVAQWLRVCLLMQGTRVRALVWEDPACRGAAGPVSHNC